MVVLCGLNSVNGHGSVLAEQEVVYYMGFY